MRRFVSICAAVYATIFAASLGYAVSNGGDLLKSLPAILLSEPWPVLFGMAAGPEILNSGPDEDSLGMIEYVVLMGSGFLNAFLIFGLSRLFKKRATTDRVRCRP